MAKIEQNKVEGSSLLAILERISEIKTEQTSRRALRNTLKHQSLENPGDAKISEALAKSRTALRNIDSRICRLRKGEKTLRQKEKGFFYWSKLSLLFSAGVFSGILIGVSL